MGIVFQDIKRGLSWNVLHTDTKLFQTFIIPDFELTFILTVLYYRCVLQIEAAQIQMAIRIFEIALNLYSLRLWLVFWPAESNRVEEAEGAKMKAIEAKVLEDGEKAFEAFNKNDAVEKNSDNCFEFWSLEYGILRLLWE